MSFKSIFNDYILRYSNLILLALFLIIGLFAYHVKDLVIDASTDTLILEGDKDLEYTKKVNKRYYSADFLIIAYSPKESLFAIQTLENIENISNKLLTLPQVDSVISILNVPLLQSPPKPLVKLLENVPTMRDSNVNLEFVKKEFLESPIYKENLVSKDFKTTALIINLKDNEKLQNLIDEKKLLTASIKKNKNHNIDAKKLKSVEDKYNQLRKEIILQNESTINEIRRIISNYDQDEIHLGGLSMISNDVINFVKMDLKVFGISIFIFLIVALLVIFKQIRWVIVPLITCISSVIVTSGILSLFGWKVTVISSNYISLQLIFTMAIIVHLTVKYRELYIKFPNFSQKELLVESISSMIKPCFYTVTTTIAGFSSLVFSGLLPVINFGWMMSIGIIVSLFLAFLLFPLLHLNLQKVKPNFSFEKQFPLPLYFAKISNFIGSKIVLLALIIFLFSIIGVLFLKVENSFIDYFKKSSEIYKGMKVIDEKLGGTTILDITLDLREVDLNIVDETDKLDDIDEFDDDEFDFLDEAITDEDEAKLFFTSYKMNIINKVHDYLESYEEIGKVMSFSTILKVGKQLNNNNDLDIIQLALLYSELPKSYKKIIIDPYISVEDNQARISMRIKDSMPDLRRNELINKLKKEVPLIAGLSEDKVRYSNVLILYNNMLQSLFKSQILTLGTVVALLFTMFLLLFRSVLVSLIALFPNLISIGFVLGFMGWFNIPLDLMTITIAAISMGIAVDNTIHYIYRYKIEVSKDYDYGKAMTRTHKSIGFAMYYTSVTIIVGFSILILSNFIPSIYFGLLTSMAMLIALFSSLVLLPQVLILFRPFK